MIIPAASAVQRRGEKDSIVTVVKETYNDINVRRSNRLCTHALMTLQYRNTHK